MRAQLDKNRLSRSIDNESVHPVVPDYRGGDCSRCDDRLATPAASGLAELARSSTGTDNGSIAWLVGAFVLCPCHLPITLGLAATLLAGTAVGAMLRGHPMLAGAAITVAWIAATWRGVRLLRAGRLRPTPGQRVLRSPL